MDQAQKLAGFYARAAGKAKRALLAVDPDKYSPIKASRAMGKVQAAVSRLNLETTAWADRAVDQGWRTGENRARTILEILGKKRKKPETFDGSQALKDAVALTMLKANNSMLGVAESFLALTGMAAKTLTNAELQEFGFQGAEELITAMAHHAVMAESSHKALASKIRRELASQISADNLIEIAGKRWRADRYADMVARTTLAQAQTDATLSLCRQYENDLVQWSNHGTQCPECAVFEGNVYSISGKHPNYPPLTESPPLHPNCEHSLLPTTDIAQDLIKAGPGKLGWLEGAQWLSPAGQAALALPKKPARTRKKKVIEKPKEPRKWTPAKTVEEAEQWAREELSISVDYSKTDLDVATTINENVDMIRSLGYKFDRIGPAPESDENVFYIWRHRVHGKDFIEMAYNPKYVNTMRKFRANCNASSWGFMKGDTPQATIWHELGHALDDFWCRSKNIYWGSPNIRSRELWTLWNDTFAGTTGRKTLEQMKLINRWNQTTRTRISGRYMWSMRDDGSKNVHEFFAEAYRLYRQGKWTNEWQFVADKFQEWGW